MTDQLFQARQLLQQHFGYAEFRPAQIPVIQSVLEGRDTLAVLPTGGGKSICFQIPAVLLGGLTLVVSPLISLMQDQVEAARARGLPAMCLNSSMSKAAQHEVSALIAEESLRLLYVSPERLEKLSLDLERQHRLPRLLVVDEAHCIAEWGHDFRPSYRKLARLRYRLGQPQAIALTGSATPDVRNDIARTLRFRRDYAFHLGSFDRRNLWFGAVRVADDRERLDALLELLRGDDQIAIVYSPTRKTSEWISFALTQAGHRAVPYHAGLSKTYRAETLANFLADRVDVIVATSAFGMGIDKPNVRLVVHWSPPPTPEAYYQEAGRAGRDGEFARCVLLWRRGDTALHQRQLEVTFPKQQLLEKIWRQSNGGVGVPANVLESAERLRRELRPERGPVDWRPVTERRRRAEARIRAVSEYARTTGCRRSALVGYFGEVLSQCSGCDHCTAHPTLPKLNPEISARVTRLRRALQSPTTVWGGCPLEPEVMLHLARCPPRDGAELADVPGVGPALASRFGQTILKALGSETEQNAGGEFSELLPLEVAIRKWRTEVARHMGVPPYLVISNAVIREIAVRRPASREQLARVPGIGPRTLAKFSGDLLAIGEPSQPNA